MLKQYTLKLPGNVYSGQNALRSVKDILEKEKVKKAAVFTDRGIVESGLLSCLLKELAGTGVEIVLFDHLKAEPDCDFVQEVADQFGEVNADFIIAVGGGSVMDTAKLISVTAGSNVRVRELLEKPELAKKQRKTLMIPTTAGTGSEATPNSIVAVPEKFLKVGIVNAEMIADYVILDEIMIRRLPMKIAAATGVDALAHAIECYTSKKANPFSDLFAMEALRLILDNIEKACLDQDALEAKQEMLLASFYAGIAITASGTTAVHALSYPLGGRYHIPHGVSNAILLLPVMRFNEPACRTRLARIYDRVNGGKGKTDQEKSGWVLGRLESIVKNLHIPVSLREYGIGDEDLDELVDAGMAVQRLLSNNLREVGREDARRIYLEVI